MSRRNDDGLFAGLGIGIIVAWVLFALVDVALLGVVIWAIIKIVNHFA